MNREEQARALFDEGVACYDDGQYEKAIDNFHRLLDEYADYIDVGGVHYWLGCSYYEKGLFDEALDHFKEAYDRIDHGQIRPGDLHIMYYLALTHYAEFHNQEALTYLNEAEGHFHLYNEVEHWESRYNFRELKGDVYLWLKQPLLAVDEYKTAHEYITSGNQRHPEQEADICRRLGRAYLHANDLETADGYMQRVDIGVLSQQSVKSFYLNMEFLRVHQKRWNEALEYFDKLREIGIPEDSLAASFSFASEAYLNLMDGFNARACLQEAIKHEQHEDWMGKYISRLQDRLDQAGY